MFKGLHCCFSSHGRKIIKKLIQLLPAFQVVQQGLEGDTRASENRGAAEHVGVSDDYIIENGLRSTAIMLSLLSG